MRAEYIIPPKEGHESFYNGYGEVGWVNYGSNAIWFHHRDVRWVNAYGRALGGVDVLWEHGGKIIGDE